MSQNFVQKPLIDKILDDPRLRLYDNPDWPQWREDLKRIRQATANSPLPQTTLDFHLHSFILPRLESGGLSIEVDFVEQVISRIQSIQEQSSSRSQNRRPSGPTSVIPFRPGFKKNKK